VKVLIERTASSLDDSALKKLFVSVQQNNIELCIQYAINDLTNDIEDIDTKDMMWFTMTWTDSIKKMDPIAHGIYCILNTEINIILLH